ncbi:heparinase II/III family protein [Thermophagus sp. OGC60D27]|uniref:heparinase II/III family protein n=1 Tax=Thermophagus sp. OGC60D27 TaxID=3458415 RepID=UPI00403796AA
MVKILGLFLALFFAATKTISSQNSHDGCKTYVSDCFLMEMLDDENNEEIKGIVREYNRGNHEKGLKQFTYYFKERLKERFFFSHDDFRQRFSLYNQLYPSSGQYHQDEAKQHMELYSPEVPWKMPFVNLKGEVVTSYPYRHLTRQHKADDIAFMYYYTNEETYLNYIPTQAQSLNDAFGKGEYERVEDGNGVFEAFRAGNRVFNWLLAHQILLASDQYSWEQQLVIIKNLLLTASKIAEHNKTYKQGNHQTRGMSALLMISLIFKEFNDAADWQRLAINNLEEHLRNEVYPDGFQFERGVHYHQSDIFNYLYAYQAAKVNGISLSPIWEERLRGMFDVLTKIALPNKKAPVLQDDTDKPWAEFNDIDEIMCVGAMIFGDPVFSYFASELPPRAYFWLLSSEQLKQLVRRSAQQPTVGSVALKEVGYYVMRQGWNDEDLYLIISAGVTQQKPDHQHGDVLGIQAYAFGEMVLPNYQVRYFLPDLAEFKNSFTKNVALADSVPQGTMWKGNKGGSGFGKWENLPNPTVHAWGSTNSIDYFVGSHDGDKDQGIDYFRGVFFLKNAGWLVRDYFVSECLENHSFQQVWQGHYSQESQFHMRSVFPSGAGLDIVQLLPVSDEVGRAIRRGKGRIVVESRSGQTCAFTTLLYPFASFADRLELKNTEFKDLTFGEWRLYEKTTGDGNKVVCLEKENDRLILGSTSFKLGDDVVRISGKEADLFVEKINNNQYKITNCGISSVSFTKGADSFNLAIGDSCIVESSGPFSIE